MGRVTSGLEAVTISTIALYIPSIDMGGAERQMLELAKGIDKGKWNVVILTNSVNPLLASEVSNLQNTGIVLLNKKNRVLYPLRLLLTLRRIRPSIITSYLLSAQGYTLMIRLFLGQKKIIFSVRDSSNYSAHHGAMGVFFKMLIEKSLPFVDGYIFNSVAGRKERSSLPDGKVYVVPNGIDTVKYHPDPSSHSFVRREAGIADDAMIVGIVGNFSTYKGYDTFIRAARIVAAQVTNARFVTVGDHDTSLGKAMRELVGELELTDSFHFLGLRRDVSKLLPGFDVLCSSSVTEGFSNAICEGMACGIPCVVTDVGDSALIVGDTGIVVPPSAPESLAAGILRLLRMTPVERQQLGAMARLRIEENFSIPRMVEATEQVFKQVLADR